MTATLIGISVGLLQIVTFELLKKFEKDKIYALTLSAIGFLYVGFTWTDITTFIISGISTTFIIKSASTRQYAMQRSKRLLIPLVIGVLLIVPPQIYFERLFQGLKYDSYLTFYPSIFSTGF